MGTKGGVTRKDVGGQVLDPSRGFGMTGKEVGAVDGRERSVVGHWDERGEGMTGVGGSYRIRRLVPVG